MPDPKPTLSTARTQRTVDDATMAAVYMRTLIAEGIGAFAATQLTAAYIGAMATHEDIKPPYGE